MNDVNFNEVIEKIKDQKREEIFRDEPLEGIFKHEGKSRISLKIVTVFLLILLFKKLISLFVGIALALFSGAFYYFYHIKQKRNFQFSNFFKFLKFNIN